MWNPIMSLRALQMWSEPHTNLPHGQCYKISIEIMHKVARCYSVIRAAKTIQYVAKII